MAVKIAWGDEKRLWKIPHWYEVWCGMTSLGLLDGQVYMLQRNQKVFRADAATGEKNAGPWDVGVGDDVKLAVYACAYQVTDLDAGQGQVVLSYARHNLVRRIDPKDGKTIDEAEVPEPYGVAIGPDARVYVLSQDRVVSLSRQDKTLREVVPAGQIDAGFRLAVDPASGDILVAENEAMRGSPHHVLEGAGDGEESHRAAGEAVRQGREAPRGVRSGGGAAVRRTTHRTSTTSSTSLHPGRRLRDLRVGVAPAADGRV